MFDLAEFLKALSDIRNIDEHLILNEDMQKLSKKVKQCKLCEREGK